MDEEIPNFWTLSDDKLIVWWLSIKLDHIPAVPEEDITTTISFVKGLLDEYRGKSHDEICTELEKEYPHESTSHQRPDEREDQAVV